MNTSHRFINGSVVPASLGLMFVRPAIANDPFAALQGLCRGCSPVHCWRPAPRSHAAGEAACKSNDQYVIRPPFKVPRCDVVQRGGCFVSPVGFLKVGIIR